MTRFFAMFLLILIPLRTEAAVTFTFTEVGPDVIMTYTGTVDLTGLTSIEPAGTTGVAVFPAGLALAADTDFAVVDIY